MTRFVAAVIIAVFCMSELRLAGSWPTPLGFSALVIGGWSVFLLGASITRWAGCERHAEFPIGMEFVTGLATADLLIMGLINAADISAGCAFLVVATATLVTCAAARVWFGRTAGVGRIGNVLDDAPVRVSELLHLGGLCILVLVWSRLQATALPSLYETGSAPVWSDYFIHANEIAQYARDDGLARGSIILIGEPIELYHRAIFVIPAAISQLTEVSALAAATALLLPIGLLCCLLGVHVLASTVSGDKLTGLLAAVLLAVLPDSSSYGLSNGFFSISWLLFTSPGTGWALGICTTSLALLCVALREHNRRVVTVAFFLGLSAFWHRAHIFIHYFPGLSLLALVAVLRSDKARSRWLSLIKSSALAVAGLCLLAWFLPTLRSRWLAMSAVDEFLLIAHDAPTPTGYDGWYAHFLNQYGVEAAVPAGLALTILATLGGLLPAYAISFWVKRRQFGWEPIDAFPLMLLGVFVAFILFGPSTYGRFTEYQHRGFPLLYTVALTYTVAYLSLLTNCLPRVVGVTPRWIRSASLLVAVAGGGLAMRDADPSKPRFAWGFDFHGLAVSGSLLRAGDYLAAHARQSDTMAVVPTEPEVTLNDVASNLIALSGTSAYIARAGLAGLGTDKVVPGFGNTRLQQVTAERLAVLNGILTTASRNEAFRTLEEQGISWLIASQAGALQWDKDAQEADFRDGPFAIYRVDPHP